MKKEEKCFEKNPGTKLKYILQFPLKNNLFKHILNFKT